MMNPNVEGLTFYTEFKISVSMRSCQLDIYTYENTNDIGRVLPRMLVLHDFVFLSVATRLIAGGKTGTNDNRLSAHTQLYYLLVISRFRLIFCRLLRRNSIFTYGLKYKTLKSESTLGMVSLSSQLALGASEG